MNKGIVGEQDLKVPLSRREGFSVRVDKYDKYDLIPIVANL